jgi:nucleoside-diphosphate-sugar epimerase
MDAGKEIAPGALVLVTGAAGGVGSHVVRALVRAGFMVRATDRVVLREAMRALEADGVAPGVVEWVRAELTRAGDAERLVAGCQAIIHTAAQVSLSESQEELQEPNARAVERLFAAATEAGVAHMVHFSCASLYKQGKGSHTEQTEIEPTNAYEQSKWDGEQILHAAPAGQTRWTILRPGLLYGPFCKTMSAGIVTIPPMIHQFMHYLPGFTGGPRTNWCHAEDAAEAALCVLGLPAAYGQVYNVADATPLGMGEVLTSITEAYGLELGPMLPFPSAGVQETASPVVDRDVVFDVLRMALRALWKRVCHTQHLASPLRPRVDRKALIYTSGDAIVDASALRALGWRPKWEGFRSGVVDTIQWYQDHGWAPRYDSQSKRELEEADRQRGFGFGEVLEGHWTDASGREREMKLDLDIEFPPIPRFARRAQGNLDGTVWVRGLAAHVPLHGTIQFPLWGQGRIVYEFGFVGDADEVYRFYGHKDLIPMHPLRSLEVLEGALVNGRGREVGRARLSFSMKEQLVPLLMSLRFLLRPNTPTSQIQEATV